jgi:hypothetical protein
MRILNTLSHDGPVRLMRGGRARGRSSAAFTPTEIVESLLICTPSIAETSKWPGPAIDPCRQLARISRWETTVLTIDAPVAEAHQWVLVSRGS